MTIRIAIHHLTRYHYDRPILLSPHVLRLRPAPHTRTPVLAYSLKIEPKNHFINWQQDPFGNFLARLVFPEKSRILSIEVDLIADMTVIDPFNFFVEESAQKAPFGYEPALRRELAPYLETEPVGPLMQSFLDGVERVPYNTNDFLVDLNRRVWKTVGYAIRMEPGVQTCEQTLTTRSGSCRDSAWLLVQALRHVGLAARFVSGYLVQLTADVKSLDGPSGPEKDFTDLHAWAEVYVPGAGWLGLDPTSGLLAGEGHIPLACAPDPAGAAAVTGLTEPCESTLEFVNEISRIHEDPRVTKPYDNGQWQIIDALGRKTDADLQKNDARLTMGGEPTFVSIDDMEGEEWNTAAFGADKRRRAEDLARRLKLAFAPGGVMLDGQGKWYPGEPLPRWRLTCVWRADGLPVWQDHTLLAEEAGGKQKLDETHAHAFAIAVAQQLGVPTDHVIPAFEDPFYHQWQQSNLAVGASVAGETSIEKPVGSVLPLSPRGDGSWNSCPWPLRRQQLFLFPGDSLIGYRLPLSSLPPISPAEDETAFPTDPCQPFPPLGERPSPRPSPRKSERMVHTALCVRADSGRIHVFLPPVNRLEDWLDLLACIEDTARELELPVVLEGYEPPWDVRLRRLSVTPDPGVIEVNIHPAATWPELVHNTETLYAEARLARLATEKFMVDGHHTGTGGGNHVTVGGPTPLDSPLLRRPDLLRSLITYWQHHPGLSYLFSGTFIGPTSQAPRVDEGRDDALYELELAFHHMPDGETNQPWLVDRLLRNLLVDVSGNTHRAEFCIDKLYSPDGPMGRLGILELRAFEMPPHPRMSLVQALLLRCLVAHFWDHPYHRPLVRWGTALHDRFMLPHYVMGDMADVCQELTRAGYPFDPAWLAPFEEFRFPHHGRVQVGDMGLELRSALEPWPVLGEESSRQGTARYVDSSLERIQIKATGFVGDRHVVTCNGRRVVLSNTGIVGEYVAGVRYRAWQPPLALHPTIGVHSPLVFDIVDTWNRRAVGGCTYHVIHPGGRHFETYPVNAFEAEARRITRFEDFGHTPGVLRPPPIPSGLGRFIPEGTPLGEVPIPPLKLDSEFPHTLDLRNT